MTKDDIIRMAREAGGQGLAKRDFIDLERFAALVAAAEREECAKVVDENAAGSLGLLKHVLRENANAIRSRGNND